MKYKISAPNPISHLLEIELHLDRITSDELVFQLPSWRPGRYELGNFARNIQKWTAVDSNGDILPYKKISKDCWVVKCEKSEELTIRYNYYSSQLDAGGCWVYEDQVYINPIHCFLYIPERIHEKCFVELQLPENYQVVSSLRKLNPALLRAEDYHELVDSPILASAALQHNYYYDNNIMFNIWFQGSCRPDWTRIINDFSRFTSEQISVFGDFPSPEFHFIVQMLPYKFYHGVEHLNSTVLALGPGSDLMTDEMYVDFVGVASHELFHVWNIKTIKPVEMLPYNYTRENYSRLGFVYEGVTTYYGDLFLVRSGVYSADQFFTEMNQRIQKHMDNFGRLNMSVVDASFDTWLDGYVPGIPNRKTSIYDEGCLTALMTDLMIRAKTNNSASLDEVMKVLYTDFGKQKIGYTEHDYLSIVENTSGESFTDFFMDYIYGTESYEPMLQSLLNLAGCLLEKRPSKNYFEEHFGFKAIVSNNITKVSAIVPESAAEHGGLGKDDEIIAVNEIKVDGDLDSLCRNFAGEKIVFTLLTPMKKLKDIALVPAQHSYYPRYRIRKMSEVTIDQKEFFKAWLKCEF